MLTPSALAAINLALASLRLHVVGAETYPVFRPYLAGSLAAAARGCFGAVRLVARGVGAFAPALGVGGSAAWLAYSQCWRNVGGFLRSAVLARRFDKFVNNRLWQTLLVLESALVATMAASIMEVVAVDFPKLLFRPA